MNHIRYILFAPLFVLGACSSGTWEDIELPKPEEMEEEFSNVNFSASMNQGQEGDGDTPYFRSGDEIRISTPSSYATPDFDKTGGYYTYVYSEKKMMNILINSRRKWRVRVLTGVHCSLLPFTTFLRQCIFRVKAINIIRMYHIDRIM